MTSVANNDKHESAEINLPRPGQRLHAARVATDLDLPKLAAQLHLSEETLHAVEADDYASLPARVFVRGYYRNYARILGLPESEILAELDQAWPEEREALTIQPVGRKIKPEVRSSHSLVQLVTWLIVLGSIGLFVVWWVGYLQWQTQPQNGTTSSQEETAGEAGVLSLPLSAAGEPAAGEGEAPAPEVSEPGAIPLPPPLSGQDESATESGTTVAEAEPAVAEPVEEAASAPARVTVRFSEDCWTDIRDSSRSFRLFGIIKAGTVRELGGEPPYNVLFGKSNAAEILIDGKVYDHSVHANANVARFTLEIPVE